MKYFAVVITHPFLIKYGQRYAMKYRNVEGSDIRWADLWDFEKNNYVYYDHSFILKKKRPTDMYAMSVLLNAKHTMNFENNAYIRAVIEYADL